jgi:hypothetical protein
MESFEVWCWRRIENLVQLCEKWRSITKSQAGEEYPTDNKMKES